MLCPVLIVCPMANRFDTCQKYFVTLSDNDIHTLRLTKIKYGEKIIKIYMTAKC